MTPPEDPRVPQEPIGAAEEPSDSMPPAQEQEEAEEIGAAQAQEASGEIEVAENAENAEDADDGDDGVDAPEAVETPAAQTVTGKVPPPPARSSSRPDLVEARDPLYRDCKGYRLRLDPPDLARLRELAGSRGKSDVELGEAFFDGQADRLAESVAGDVDAPAELRVVVDPYSRQAFVALENRIRGILSF